MLVRLVIISSLLGVSSCAGSMSKMRQAVSDAPDWYDERRVEIRGDGYPRITRVRALNPPEGIGKNLTTDEAQLADAEARLVDHERSELSDTTPEDILAFTADSLAKFGPVETPPDILTMAEIEELKSVFDRYGGSR